MRARASRVLAPDGEERLPLGGAGFGVEQPGLDVLEAVTCLGELAYGRDGAVLVGVGWRALPCGARWRGRA